MLAIALLLAVDGSYYGLLIAWIFGTWGAMVLAWGLLAGWSRSLVACTVASVFALAAMLVALFFVPRDGWEIAIPCAVGSGLALIFGLVQIAHLWRRRATRM